MNPLLEESTTNTWILTAFEQLLAETVAFTIKILFFGFRPSVVRKDTISRTRPVSQIPRIQMVEQDEEAGPSTWKDVKNQNELQQTIGSKNISG